MSTMYDALRKAEAERKKAEGLDNKDPEAGNAASSGGMTENTKIILLLVAVIVVFGITLFRINSILHGPKRVVPVQAINLAPAVKVVPIKPQIIKDPYTLNGIIDAGDNSMAIINGKLLKPEDSIDDLILKKILSKKVELLNTKDNSTLILKIK